MVAAMLGPLGVPASVASAAPTLELRVLLIGDSASDPTTGAWESALADEGVPYTEADATSPHVHQRLFPLCQRPESVHVYGDDGRGSGRGLHDQYHRERRVAGRRQFQEPR